MRVIKPGDVYFLKSPIKMASPEHEKKLAYLLHTVSARPVVIIKPPHWWDDYNTITVLPALSDAKYAITFHLYDRYGMIAESEFPVTPHTPHSVPISRLGQYLGSLDDAELEELLYAYKWIHDEKMQKTEPVPKCYQKVFGDGVIIPKARNRKPKPTPTIRVDEHNHLHIMNVTSGVGADINIPIEMVQEPKDNNYKIVDECSLEAETETVIPDSGTVVAMNRFPKSIFSEDDLSEVANRFNFDADFFDESKTSVLKRDWRCLSDDELQIISPRVGNARMQGILDLYDTMYPVDALLLGPHLPTNVLCRLCRFSVNEGATLKRLCNVLRDMPEDEYRTRMENLARPKIQKTSASVDIQTPKKTNALLPALTQDAAEQREIIGRLRPWLNGKMMSKIPVDRYNDFLRCPTYIIRKAYTGKGFQTLYTTTYARIKREVLDGKVTLK